MSESPVSQRRVGAVAVVEVDSPPVNALSQAVRAGLEREITAALADGAVTAVVLACKGRTFIAGADITEFNKPPQPPMLTTVIDLMENASKPVIAAIHGTALGGGLETALGAHFRVAVPSAKIGLPEVKLGILPGAGGTQRLPRLIGPLAALPPIVSGEPIGAAEAHRLGAVDAVIEGDLVAGAVAFADQVVAEGRPLRRLNAYDEKTEAAKVDLSAFDALGAKLTAKARGLKAPTMCVESVRNSMTLPFAEGMKREREIFEALRTGDQSKAQRHLFFAERAAQKIADMPKDTKARPIAAGAVLGAGTMGAGIAMNFANAGIPVVMVDLNPEALEKGLATIRTNYERTAARGGMDAAEVEKRLALVTGSTDFAAVADADIVIEAVFEDMALKTKIFADLDRTCKPGAVLATNTSTLDINGIAAATGRPEDVVGMHFFSPANVMRLLENVRGDKTAMDVLKTAMDLGKRMGKAPVMVGVCEGFVGNRMLYARGAQVERLMLEGAMPSEIDAALTAFGFPMGPCAMSDLAGLDVSWRVRKGAGRTAAVADAICELGRFGQKTGRGYFLYEDGSRRPVRDEEIEALIRNVAKDHGFTPREIDRQEIFERLVYPMINEAAQILDEGIAARASDIDVVWVYGYGWPVGEGGPMFYADKIGAAVIRDRLATYAEATGDERLAPAPLLEKLAREGGMFGAL